LDRLSLTEYQQIKCQWSCENPIYEGRKIVELDLRRAQTRQKFANSSRIHEDVDATSGRGTGCAPGALRADRANGVAVETISVALPRSFV